MQDKFQHFLYVPFTGLGLHGGYRGDQWLENRIEIFKRFVLPSIQNQTNKNFTVWFSWRKEDAYNPIVEEFVIWLAKNRLPDVIHTYSGVCFWDDKYNDATASQRLLNSLVHTLPKLEMYCMNASHVLMTIQPSDDMYSASMVEDTQRFFEGDIVVARKMQRQPKYQVFGYERGYIMNYATLQMAEYNPITTPPFYTICFPREAFLNPEAHYKFTGPYHSHEYVGNFLAELRLPDRMFVVGTHGENISTTFIHPYKGRELPFYEAQEVRESLGIKDVQPVVVRRNGRLVARMILNRLPFQRFIRDLYYKLPTKLQIL